MAAGSPAWSDAKVLSFLGAFRVLAFRVLGFRVLGFKFGAIGVLSFPAALGFRAAVGLEQRHENYMGVSENRGPLKSTPNSRILIIRTPK